MLLLKVLIDKCFPGRIPPWNTNIGFSSSCPPVYNALNIFWLNLLLTLHDILSGSINTWFFRLRMSIRNFFAHIYTMWLSLSDPVEMNSDASSYFIRDKTDFDCDCLPLFLILLMLSFLNVKKRFWILNDCK